MFNRYFVFFSYIADYNFKTYGVICVILIEVVDDDEEGPSQKKPRLMHSMLVDLGYVLLVFGLDKTIYSMCTLIATSFYSSLSHVHLNT